MRRLQSGSEPSVCDEPKGEAAGLGGEGTEVWELGLQRQVGHIV